MIMAQQGFDDRMADAGQRRICSIQTQMAPRASMGWQMRGTISRTTSRHASGGHIASSKIIAGFARLGSAPNTRSSA